MDYKQYNDYELIYMVNENDENSRNLLVNKYKPLINSIAGSYYRNYKCIGYQYEDFYLETMFAFYNALYSYDPSKDALFYTYVILCMRRSLSSYVRGIQSDKKRAFLDNYVELDEISYCIEDPKTNLENIYNGLEMESLIKNLMYDIPLKLSSILELKLNGFNFVEIAYLLDIPRSTVEYRIRRIRKILQSKIRQEYCK